MTLYQDYNSHWAEIPFHHPIATALPSYSTLLNIYGNRDMLNERLAELDGGIKLDDSERYWSGSEKPNNEAYFVDFSDGELYYFSRNNKLRARMVRFF